MNPKNKIEAGEFFFRFYRKRISSFLVTIYKAGVTGKDKDIHKLRVDLKKVIALFNFFELLEFSGFDIRKNTRQFRDIFRQAGKIREIQVNLKYMEKYIEVIPGALSFSGFLRKEQKKYTKSFIDAVVGFDEQKLKSVSKTVKRFCNEIDSGSIIEKSADFLYRKAGIIKKLAEHPEEGDNVHKIRQELKKMGAIASLFAEVRPGQEIKQWIVKLQQAEVMIGNWHDRFVLIEALNHFLKSGPVPNHGSSSELESLIQTIETENAGSLGTIMPMVIGITEMIRRKPSQDLNKQA